MKVISEKCCELKFDIYVFIAIKILNFFNFRTNKYFLEILLIFKNARKDPLYNS